MGVFKPFVDQQMDFTVLQALAPVFSKPPGLNSDELLVLTGYYPSQPSVTYFTLKFTYEHPAWKLAGVNVQVK